jgi:hypothetical protein
MDGGSNDEGNIMQLNAVPFVNIGLLQDCTRHSPVPFHSPHSNLLSPSEFVIYSSYLSDHLA